MTPTHDGMCNLDFHSALGYEVLSAVNNRIELLGTEKNIAPAS